MLAVIYSSSRRCFWLALHQLSRPIITVDLFCRESLPDCCQSRKQTNNSSLTAQQLWWVGGRKSKRSFHWAKVLGWKVLRPEQSRLSHHYYPLAHLERSKCQKIIKVLRWAKVLGWKVLKRTQFSKIVTECLFFQICHTDKSCPYLRPEQSRLNSASSGPVSQPGCKLQAFCRDTLHYATSHNMGDFSAVALGRGKNAGSGSLAVVSTLYQQRSLTIKMILHWS